MSTITIFVEFGKLFFVVCLFVSLAQFKKCVLLKAAQSQHDERQRDTSVEEHKTTAVFSEMLIKPESPHLPPSDSPAEPLNHVFDRFAFWPLSFFHSPTADGSDGGREDGLENRGVFLLETTWRSIIS